MSIMKNNYYWFLGVALLWLTFSCHSDEASSLGSNAALSDTSNEEIQDTLHLSRISQRLVEPAEVKQWYTDGKDFKVIEISKRDEFETGHLPGAISFWRPDYEGEVYNFSGMRPSAKKMANLLGKSGIGPEDFIVIYDTKGCVDALRFFWILEMYGHDKISVMNGGKVAWVKDGFDLTTAHATAIPVPYIFEKEPDYSRLANKEEVLTAVSDSNTIILDTREPEEFQGVPYISKGVDHPFKKGSFTHGRIQGAVHLNWSDAVDLKSDHRFKSLKELRYNFKQAGVTPDKKIIAYCQSGVRSAHTTFVLTDLLGFKHVRNYDGSWIEWSYHYTTNGNLPIERDIDEKEHQIRLAELEAIAVESLK